MSGDGAMSVCGDGRLLCGCDRAESDLCERFAAAFVRACAGVIVGVKPLALFLFACDFACAADRRRMTALLGTYGREFERYGVCLRLVGHFAGRHALLAYRPRLVDDVICDEANRAFLVGSGYDASCCTVLMRQFRARLGAYYDAKARGVVAPAFPHELGLLFGYPLADVVGYIRGERMTARGSWRAYGDPDEARARFRFLSDHEDGCKRRYADGQPLTALLAATA